MEAEGRFPCYGYLGTFPALTADYFGSRNVGMIYGMVLLGFGVGAVAASFIGGYFINTALAAAPAVLDMGILFKAFVIASIASVVGAIIMVYTKQPGPVEIDKQQKSRMEA